MRDTDNSAPPPCTVAFCCGADSFAPCDDNGATNYCRSDTSNGVQMYGYIVPDYGMITSWYECPIENCLCENGGTCTGPDGTCECKDGCTGDRCEIPSPCSAALCCGTDTCISCDKRGIYCRGIDDNDIGDDPSTRSRFGLAKLGVHDRYFGVFNCPYACSFGSGGLRSGRSLNASAC
ncbi:unnamed protein product [Adineta steineri]|uniref:EGF-like domain-containing protein n=1 Tax=Adineta steineri TaxID=433720 RepID=A0A814IKI3_9BILA|nr:unnamed protein product [Adineta steineri]CAF1403590.1 unnamed protein product [Adineta steineri]